MPAANPVKSSGFELVTLEAQPIPAAADGKAPPAEVRLLPAGTFRTLKGSFRFDANAAQAVLEKAKDWGNDYCFDMGHSMVAPQPGSDPAANERAYGWYRLKVNAAGELVTDGLTWTDMGASMLSKREVRYLSPTIRTDKDGRVVEFINAALTNLPATKGMRPIVASRSPHSNEEHPMETVLLALGLSQAASESEALASVTALRDFRKDLLALAGKTEESEALKEVSTWKARSAELPVLTAKVDKMLAKKAEKKALKMVKDAIEEKKLPPSLEEKALELARKDRKFFKEYLKSLGNLAAITKTDVEKRQTKDEVDLSALTKEDLEVAKALSLDPKAFAAMKAKGVHHSEFVPKDTEEKSGTEAKQ